MQILLNMRVPGIDKTNIPIIFCCFLDNYSNFISKRIISLLLCDLAVEYELHAIVVFLDQLIQVLFGLLLLVPQYLIGKLDFFQFMYFFANQLDILFKAVAIVF